MIEIKNVEDKINEIEAEMKKIDLWQNEPLPAPQYDFKEAFGSDKMSFAQWLQFIFIPNVKKLLSTNGPWPPASQVGIYAVQEFMFFRPTENTNEFTTGGSIEEHGKELNLVGLLSEFDEIFNSQNINNE
jgi:uncharacterized protein YqcC (DUF446 family)